MKAACVFPSDTSKSLYKLTGYILFNQEDKNSNVDVSILINNIPLGRYGICISEYNCISNIKLKNNKLSIKFMDPLISLFSNDEGCIVNKKLYIYNENINNVIAEANTFLIF